MPNEALVFGTDLCKPDVVSQVVAETIAKFETIDLLVSNAGATRTL